MVLTIMRFRERGSYRSRGQTGSQFGTARGCRDVPHMACVDLSAQSHGVAWAKCSACMPHGRWRWCAIASAS